MSQTFLKQNSSNIFQITPNSDNRNEKLAKNSSEYTFNNNNINNNDININKNDFVNKNNERNIFEKKFKNAENPFILPEIKKEDKEESNNERININKDKNIIGGQRYKKSDKIQNIANELEKVMFPKSKS